MDSSKALVVPRSVVPRSPKIDLSKAAPTRVSTPPPNEALLLIRGLLDGSKSRPDSPPKIVRYLGEVEDKLRAVSLSHLGKPSQQDVKNLADLIVQLCEAAKVETQKMGDDPKKNLGICVSNFNLLLIKFNRPAIEISKKIKARRFKRSDKGGTPAIQPKDSHDEVIPAQDHVDAGTTTTTTTIVEIVEVDDWEQLAGPDNESV